MGSNMWIDDSRHKSARPLENTKESIDPFFEFVMQS